MGDSADDGLGYLGFSPTTKLTRSTKAPRQWRLGPHGVWSGSSEDTRVHLLGVALLAPSRLGEAVKGLTTLYGANPGVYGASVLGIH